MWTVRIDSWHESFSISLWNLKRKTRYEFAIAAAKWQTKCLIRARKNNSTDRAREREREIEKEMEWLKHAFFDLFHLQFNSFPLAVVFIVLHKWKLIRENVVCFSIFYLQWRKAKIECKSNRIESSTKNRKQNKREIREIERERVRQRESEWDAIQTTSICNWEKLPADAQWKTYEKTWAQLKR